MLTEALSVLLQNGLLGAVAALSIIWGIRKDKQATIERKQHEDEMRAMLERYITKAESWTTKYHDLARELRDLVQAIRSAARGQT